MIIGHNRKKIGRCPVRRRPTRYSIGVIRIARRLASRARMTPAPVVPSLLMLCALAVYFALCGALAAKPVVTTDPFQRYVIFYNELPITIYPVITAVEKENGGMKKKGNQLTE